MSQLLHLFHELVGGRTTPFVLYIPLTTITQRAPLWEGLAALGGLVTAFGLAAWWLFLSPIAGAVPGGPPTARVLATRRTVGSLILVASAFGGVGGEWDEIWHRTYGLVNDLLWPPHSLLYGWFALNALSAGIGLRTALRGAGGLRQKFRAEPLLGLVGLLSCYQLASIPSDLVWHQVIGPDISAWSIPHLLLEVIATAVRLAGIAMILSTLPKGRPWASILARPSMAELVVVGLLGFTLLNNLEVMTTEWDWLDTTVLSRPEWTLPVVTLLTGCGNAFLALYATRRVGAATVTAIIALLIHGLMVAVGRSTLPPGPMLTVHLLILAPALSLDCWFALAARRAPLAVGVGTVLYSAVFVGLAFPFIAAFMVVPRLDPPSMLATVALGVPGALILSTGAAWLGSRLETLGSPLPVRAVTTAPVAELDPALES